jgi:hypothetical protein
MTRQETIDHAVHVWQPWYERTLSQADGAEIADTMAAYLQLIAEWVADVALVREGVQ